MGVNEILVFSVSLTFSGILVLLFLPAKWKSGATLFFVAANIVLTSIVSVLVLSGQHVDTILPGSSLFGLIPVRVDALSAWFMLIINLTCINGMLYGMGYMKAYSQQKSNLSFHWILFLIFHSSMLWVCMFQHSLAFLVAWELMSISSMLLVIFEHQQKNVLKAGINYLVQMHISVVLLTIGFIWVFSDTGSFDFKSVGQFFGIHSNIGIFAVFFIGFGIKAGFIPFHTWLPQAHPAAPSHISGVMSGVIVKLGIYGILRIILYLRQDYILLGEVILVLSILTGVFGMINSAVHRNFKKMLAYCTIENIGIIGMGIGLGLIGIGNNNQVLILAGFGGALLHVLNHSLFKSLLFFSAGSVYQQTHTKNMEKLGGLIRKMPQTAWLFLIGSLAIGGLPPFNGFVSEFILYSGFLSGINHGVHQTALMVSAIAGLALIGGISVLAFTKSFGTIFLGSPRTRLHNEPHEVSLLMRIPQFLIVAIMISVGFFPAFYFRLTGNIAAGFIPSGSIPQFGGLIGIAGLIGHIGRYMLLFVGIIAGMLLIRFAFAKRLSEVKGPTWGCGYVNPTPKIQYTGKSFSKSLAKLLVFTVTEKKKFPEITSGEIFPRHRAYSSFYIDKFGSNINKLTDRLIYTLNYFQFIQNGNIQMYILYGLVFILLIFFGTAFNFM